MAEKIEELRDWARTRTIPASTPEAAEKQTKRRLSE
jgi:hypothetical protein